MSEIQKVITLKEGPDMSEKRITGIINWHQLLKMWEENDEFSVLSGLLHRGFEVSLERDRHDEPRYHEADRLAFYFAIARGWKARSLDEKNDKPTNYECGRDENGRVIRRNEGQFRALLARKAFEMLATNLFDQKLNSEDGYGGELSSFWEINIVPLLPLLEGYFCTSHPHKNVWNLDEPGTSKSFLDEQALNFVLNVARFLWRWQKPEYRFAGSEKHAPYHEEVRNRIEAAKPWMIRVLAATKKLNVIRQWILKLDDVCLEVLRQIAMDTEVWPPNSNERRNVESLEEAFLEDSHAARFLYEYDIKKKAYDRRIVLLETESQIEELTQKRELLKQPA